MKITKQREQYKLAIRFAFWSQIKQHSKKQRKSIYATYVHDIL